MQNFKNIFFLLVFNCSFSYGQLKTYQESNEFGTWKIELDKSKNEIKIEIVSDLSISTFFVAKYGLRNRKLSLKKCIIGKCFLNWKFILPHDENYIKVYADGKRKSYIKLMQIK